MNFKKRLSKFKDFGKLQIGKLQSKAAIPFFAGVLTILVLIIVLAIRDKSSIGSPDNYPRFVSAPLSGWDYKSTKEANLKTSIKETAEGGKVQVEHGNSSVSFDIPLSQGTLQKEGNNTIAFKDNETKVTTKYEITPNSLKEEIVFEKAPGSNRINIPMQMENVEIYLSPSNLPVFYNSETGEYRFHIEAPFAFDSSGNGAKTYDLKYLLIEEGSDKVLSYPYEKGAVNALDRPIKVSEEGKDYRLVLEVDSDWFSDPVRVYPVIVDPTISHDTQGVFASGAFNRTRDGGASNSTPKLESSPQELSADEYTVGLWHFNEPSNDTCGANQDACDSSGKGNHLAATNTTVEPGLFNNARGFSSTDYLSINDNSSLDLTTAYTLEAWVYPTSLNNWAHIVTKGKFDSSYGMMIYGGGTNKLRCYTNNTNNLDSNTIFETEKWYYVACVWNGTTKSIYVNGKLDNTGSWSGTLTNNTSALTIGREMVTNNYNFVGKIDEVRISNIARTPEEIKASFQKKYTHGIYTSEVLDSLKAATEWETISFSADGISTGNGETLYDSTGLVAQWNFNEASGTTAAVSAGSCGTTCNGTLQNFADTSGKDAAPLSGWTSTHRRWGDGALMFDGNNDLVSSADYDFSTNDFSIEAWINPLSTAAADKMLITKDVDGDGNYQFRLGLDSSNKLFFMISNSNNTDYLWDGSSYTLSSPTPLELGEWHKVAISRSGTNYKLYVDGINVDNATTSTIIDNNSSYTISLGARNNGSMPFRGMMDSVRIYSRALSPAEILSNYNSSEIIYQGRTSADSTNWSDWYPKLSKTTVESFDSSHDDWVFDRTPEKETVNVGTGNDGAVTVSSSTNISTTNLITGRSCADGGDAVNYSVTSLASSSETSITLSSTPSSGCLSAGDEILIINMQGVSGNYSNVGKYETHIISSVDGATLNFTDSSLTNTYDGTTQKIMVQRVPNYSDVTINSGQTLNVSAWDGSKGGVLFFRANGNVTNSGSINLNGLGYHGGVGVAPGAANVVAQQGESLTPPANSTNANNGGGGGGNGNQGGVHDSAGGGGAGFSANGTSGGGAGGGGWTTPGAGGAAYGSNNDSLLFLGSGGGAGGGADPSCGNIPGGNGGTGGGLLVVFANNLSSAGSITANGTAGQGSQGGACSAGGGGGSGGMVILETNNNISTISPTVNGASGGASTQWAGGGGTGSAGRKVLSYPPESLYPESLLTTHTSSIQAERSNSMLIRQGINEPDSSTAGLWHFEETSGTGAYLKDSSENDIHLTPTNTSLADSPFNKARKFNGSSDYVSSTTLPTITTTNWTIEAWINPSSINQLGIAVANGNDAGGYGFGITNGAGTGTGAVLSVVFHSIGWLNCGYSFPAANKWYYVTITRDTSTTRCFVNGVQTANTSTSNVNTPASRFSIGMQYNSSNSPSRFFSGSVDEVRISNIARTANEIAENYRLGRDHRVSKEINSTDLSNPSLLPFYIASDQKGPSVELTIGESAFANYEPDENTVGLWHLEEQTGSGAYLRDSSGNGNDGTPTGAAFTQGRIGKGRSFSGSSQYISTGSNVAFANESFTLEAWAKRNATNAYHLILGQGTKAANNGLHIGFRDNNVFTCGFYSNDLDSPVAYPDSDWHYWTCTFNSTTKQRRLYRDGVMVAQDTASANYQGSGQFTIGAGYSSPDFYFNGLIDEVRVSNIARTPEEIRQTYEINKRSYQVTIDFKANLANTNLIADVNDLSFDIDETQYGTSTKAPNLFPDDKIIIKENYDGTEYIAQGIVASVNTETGAITVSSWDETSTFPSGGFSINATVFKWQQEYVNLSGSLNTDRDAINRITLRLTNGSSGTNIWLDDLAYINPSQELNPEVISLNKNHRYMQYRAIFTSADPYVSASLNSANIIYSPYDIAPSGDFGDTEILDNSKPLPNPVAWWRLEEGYEDIAHNHYPNTLNGSISGAVWSSSGKFGKALSFDGSGDYVQVSDDSSLDISDSISITAWVKCAGSGGGDNHDWIVSKENTDAYQGYNFYLNPDGNLKMEILNTSPTYGSATGTTNLRDNAWHHVAGSWDGKIIKLYVDGKLENSTPYTGGLSTNDQPFYIGKRTLNYPTDYGAFNGIIDEVKIYDKAILLGQVAADLNEGSVTKLGSTSTLADGKTGSSAADRKYCVPGDTTACNSPIAEYSLNEGQGTVIYDTVSTNDGNFSDSPTWAGAQNCKTGNCLSFDGNNDYVSIGTLGSFGSSMNDFTVETWVKSTQAIASNKAILKSINTGVSMVIGIEPNRYLTTACTLDTSAGKTLFYMRDSTGKTFARHIDTNIYDGSWHHVAWRVTSASSNQMEVYIDGAYTPLSGACSQSPNSFVNFDQAIFLGAGNNRGVAGEYWAGSLDEVKIFNYARSVAQINWDYNKGTPIGWWKLNECEGTVAHDSSGNNLHGTISIGATGGNASVGTCGSGVSTEAWNNGTDGKMNASMDFDGMNDGITVSGALKGFSNTPFSISIWAKPDDITTDSYVSCGKSGATGNKRCILLGYQDNYFNLFNGGAYPTGSANDTRLPATEDQWQHIVYTTDGTRIKGYKDGRLIIDVAGNLNTATIDTYYFASPGVPSQYYNGQLDNIRIYNYALNEYQVEQLYNGDSAIRFAN